MGGPRVIALQGVAGWLMRCFHRSSQTRQRITMVERIALGPRQSLALVEADGRRFLIATSTDAGSTFLPLDNRGRTTRAARISW